MRKRLIVIAGESTPNDNPESSNPKTIGRPMMYGEIIPAIKVTILIFTNSIPIGSVDAASTEFAIGCSMPFVIIRV